MTEPYNRIDKERKSEELCRRLTENATDIIWTSDLNWNMTYISPSVTTIQGFTVEEAMALSPEYRYTQESREKIAKIFTDAMANEAAGIPLPDELGIFEAESYRKDGSTLWTETRASFIRDAAGKTIGIMGITRDVDRRKKAEVALQEAEERFRALYDRSLHAVYINDFEGNFIDANQQALSMLGYNKDDLPSLSFATLLGEEQIPLAMQKVNDLLLTGRQDKPVEYKLKCKGGEVIWVETVASLIHKDGKPYSILGIAKDITKKKQFEQKLTELATHDTVTGLPNRILLQDRFKIATGTAERKRKIMALMVLDVDSFKSVNDEFGHAIGDEVLRSIARRLTVITRKNDTVARIGGDEFVLLFTDLNSIEDVDTTAARLLAIVREPFSVEGSQMGMTASIGISLFPKDGEDIDVLLGKADAAMYKVKGSGKDNYYS